MGTFQPGDPLPPDAGCEGCAAYACERVPSLVPPIVGEEVDVVVGTDPPDTPQKEPKASRVVRVHTPKLVTGMVDTFDSHRGYGFASGDDGLSYHLHRSEVRGGLIPLEGQVVLFFAGERQKRPRACHVTICAQRRPS